MISSIKYHPFSVEAYFKTSLVLTYALPKEDLKHLIPKCLQLDTFNKTTAFIAVAIVDTAKLRPKGFPKYIGNDFILAGYRIFVRYQNNEGKSLRGLYILKSETNKREMAFIGNLFTHYNYTKTDISLKRNQNNILVSSRDSNLKVGVDTKKNDVNLPTTSPFENWKQARRFAGPLPFTFTYRNKKNDILIIQGVRTNWKPKPVSVLNQNIGFIISNFKNAKLASAFIIEDIPYYWKKAKIESWTE